MSRFGDIEPTPKTRLPPVYGYLTHPLLCLQKAVEPILSQVDQLERFTQIALTKCRFPSEHGLTRDESAAIFLYTMEWGENSFYKLLNCVLRSDNRSSLIPWFGYLKLFDTAVQKLPTVQKSLWRGLKENISGSFKKGDEFIWWTVNSCSTSVNVIKTFLRTDSTLFMIEAINGKDFNGYTNYPNESEVILCPGTCLRVTSDPLDQPPMHIVHLQEILENSMDQPSSPSPTNKASIVQICTDQEGNRYEGEMKDGKRHGTGKMHYANGDSYTGIWVDDQRTGQGIYICSDGFRYE